MIMQNCQSIVIKWQQVKTELGVSGDREKEREEESSRLTE
jgi:hypothetical protein